MNETHEETDQEEKIMKVYEQENIRLLAENKKLAAQIAVGDSDVKVENKELRRKLLELQSRMSTADDVSRVQEEYDNYVKETKQQILTLKEKNIELQSENEQLSSDLKSRPLASKVQWDENEEENKIIVQLLDNLRTAYRRQRGTEQALSQLVAIIDPDCIVSYDKPLPKQSRIPRPEAVKETPAPAPTPAPKPRIPKTAASQYQGAASIKVKALEKTIEELNQKIAEQQKEIGRLKSKAKERAAKAKEMQAQIDESCQNLINEKRQHQMELSDLQIKNQGMETELKMLQTNANYRAENEELKVKIAALEAQNSELIKPRTTGDPRSDRVLDAIARMESDIAQRQLTLSRIVDDLKDQWETEKRTIEKQYKIKIEEQKDKFDSLKSEMAKIVSQLNLREKK